MFRIFLILGLLCSLFLISTPESEAGNMIACCFPDGTCDDQSTIDCDNNGGVDSGANCGVVVCPTPTPTPTPEPTGACCTGESNEICTPDVILCGCEGIFFDDTSCEPNPCVSPTPDPGDGGSLVIVPTMTGWGMIFVTIILGVLAVIGLRRKASQDT